MNQTYLDLFNTTMINEMAKDINKKLNEENKEHIDPTPENVFKNLPMLYDTIKEKAFGEETGNSYRYMPKRYKAMVMRLIAPDYYPDVKISHINDKNGEPIGVCAEARLYLNDKDSKPVAFGKQYLPYSSVQEQFEDTTELHAYVESMVRGIALSKAYQDFGIGSWYTYSFEPEENPDATLAGLNSRDSISPTIAYEKEEAQASDNVEDTTTSQSATKNVPKKQKKQETIILSQTDSNVTDVKDTTSNVTTKKAENTNPEKNSKELISALEKARALKAPVGKAASLNMTLGETEEKYPLNILWMYTQSNISGEIQDSLKLIALNNPKILDAFTERGIALN